MSSDDSISSATLDFKLSNFSTFLSSNEPRYSEPKTIHNVCWKIMVMKKEVGNLLSPSLGIFLQCDHILKSKKSWWNGIAKGTLGILSTKPRIRDFSRRIEHLYQSQEHDWGSHRFISLAQVDAYIENDSITIRAHFEENDPADKVTKRVSKTVSRKSEVGLDTSPAKAAKLEKVELIPLPASPIRVKESDNDNDKQKSLEAEVLKLIKELTDEKSKSEKMSKDLSTKSLELEANRLTINNLESKIINLVTMGESEKKISEMSVTLNSLRGTITKLESKVATLEGQKSDKIANVESKVSRLEDLQREVDIKLKKFDDEFKEEKQRRDSFKALLRKAAE